jgi:N-acetylmuramoyl-L-alanine amidase
VFELDGRDHGYRTFHLKNPYRIVTDVYSGASRPPVPGTGAPTGFDERPVRRVVIDPGHGGKDPGATRGRVREKDVVLRISRELRTRLARNGFEVHMTRDSDTYLPVAKRPVRANRVRADLFISIHANSSPNRKTEGVETYLLDTRYDRQTARVAARENGTTVAQLSDLELIKASLRLGYTERYAARLAGDVQASLVTRLRKEHRGTGDLGVKRGPFLVLFQADMPAILIEVGFLTHRSEAKRLNNHGFARAVADGIARGVIRYRDRHARSLVAER